MYTTADQPIFAKTTEQRIREAQGQQEVSSWDVKARSKQLYPSEAECNS